MRIKKATARKIPRKFEFPWGKGLIKEEASIECSVSTGAYEDVWEPTVQLLEFENGQEALRFCVYSKGRLRRMPLLLDPRQSRSLRVEIEKNKKMKSFMKGLID